MTLSIEQLVDKIPNGAKIAVPADYAGIAMEATRALIRRNARDLHIVGVPTSGLQSELLIGAGCVSVFESSALTLGEYNPPPRFSKAVKDGSIRLVDATCPAIHAALQASQKGAPFMPLRGIIGSDILQHHPDWKVINNPFNQDEDPVVIIPAIQPDIALFHAPMADTDGNVWVGRRRELVNMAQASKTALVTVEKIVETNLLEDEKMAAGTLPALYVGGISVCKNGSWPLGFWQGAGEDSAHLSDYREKAKTDEGFEGYLQEFVFKGGDK
ncbi:CoA transferase subunit A [Sneathiella sp.]|jgi:glutaconate CoA-transferase subunit A|uniref:CoA transferase subunit A n=1 Tax=Sneathiella sp. TaxID=1964365 RepID=UPI0039E5DB60